MEGGKRARGPEQAEVPGDVQRKRSRFAGGADAPSAGSAQMQASGASASGSDAAARAASVGGRPFLAGASAPAPAGPSRTGAVTVRLDAAGRLVDEKGNVLEQEKRQASLRVNDPNRVVLADQVVTRAERTVPKRTGVDSAIAAGMDRSGRVNPYLAHRTLVVQAKAAASARPEGDAPAAAPSALAAAVLEAEAAEAHRRKRSERALHFVDEGAFRAEGDAMREEAVRRAEAQALRQRGGRNRPMRHFEDTGGAGEAALAAAEVGGATAGEGVAAAVLPRPAAAAPLAVPPKSRVPPPDIEWWDAVYLSAARAKEYTAAHSLVGKKAAAKAAAAAEPSATIAPAPIFSYRELSFDMCRTAALVQHPVPVTPLPDADAGTGGAPKPLALMLTAAERKKLRRQTRAEKHKFLLDQQKLGLLPPPEPKVKLGNMMRVLKDAAVADPSAVEARVRAQVAERSKAAEAHNLAKKLTPAARNEKWKRKMAKMGPAGPDAAVFRVADLAHGRLRFKVDVAAREHGLGGIALFAKAAGVACIYVEGGMKAVARYVKILSGLDWMKGAREVAVARAKEARGEEGEGAGARAASEEDEEDDDEEEEEDEDEDEDEESADGAASTSAHGFGPGHIAELAWRGTMPKRFFTDFSFEECRTSAAARRVMEAKGLAHVWDSVAHSEHSRRVALGEERDALGGEGEGAGLSASLFPLPAGSSS
jgi:U4/U6 small nuclear ribonucleoprotein PRP3